LRGASIAVDDEPVQILKGYEPLRIRKSKSEEKSVDEVIVSEDGRIYSQGSISLLADTSEAGIKARFQAKPTEKELPT
jgi:hypothetical protein